MSQCVYNWLQSWTIDRDNSVSKSPKHVKNNCPMRPLKTSSPFITWTCPSPAFVKCHLPTFTKLDLTLKAFPALDCEVILCAHSLSSRLANNTGKTVCSSCLLCSLPAVGRKRLSILLVQMAKFLLILSLVTQQLPQPLARLPTAT